METTTPIQKLVKQEVKKPSCLFTLTAYCPGECCNGKWVGTTAIGKPISYFLDRNINICAVDPRVIPLYSKIIYNGKVYLCVDTGGAIKGRRIDILFPTHEEATKFGVKRNVKIVRVK